jgi:hypothetical protein
MTFRLRAGLYVRLAVASENSIRTNRPSHACDGGRLVSLLRGIQQCARADLVGLTGFVAVAANLSFRVAAARLGVTPSALSHTMRRLEERLGVRLLHPTTAASH